MTVALVVRDYSRTRQLFGALVERQLRLRLKRSLLGILWPIAAPFFLFALYAFVFNSVFEVPVEHYGIFLLAGLLPWTFLAQTVGLVISSVSNEPELIRRAPFPYEYLPLSSAVVMALYFLVTLGGFVAYLAAIGWLRYGVLPFLVVPVVALLLLVGAISMLLSIVDVYNHDLRQILSNLMTIWFFLVPVVYRPGMAPSQLYFLRSVDPMNLIVSQFRDVLYSGRLFQPAHMVIMMGLCAALFVVSLAVFRRASRQLPKDV